LHYLLADVITTAHHQLQSQLEIVAPTVFAREKKYMTLVMER
jgi:hypothetical protein